MPSEEMGFDLLQREDLHPHGGEFDGQGDAIQNPTNLCDERHVFGGQGKRGMHGLGPRDKKLHVLELINI